MIRDNLKEYAEANNAKTVGNIGYMNINSFVVGYEQNIPTLDIPYQLKSVSQFNSSNPYGGAPIGVMFRIKVIGDSITSLTYTMDSYIYNLGNPVSLHIIIKHKVFSMKNITSGTSTNNTKTLVLKEGVDYYKLTIDYEKDAEVLGNMQIRVRNIQKNGQIIDSIDGNIYLEYCHQNI